ncbi:MAG: prepilin peptidase [Clostridiales bacterium]|nr:prepilin peptidase [Clostridiales bacterium]
MRGDISEKAFLALAGFLLGYMSDKLASALKRPAAGFFFCGFPVPQAMCGALFVLFGFRQEGVALCFVAAYAFIYSTIALVDLRCFLVPNALVASGFGVALLKACFDMDKSAAPLASLAIGAALCFAIALPLALAKALGMGDAKLFALSGAALGLRGAIASLALAFALAGIVCAALLALKKAKRETRIPLAPFLAAGAAIVSAFLPEI